MTNTIEIENLNISDLDIPTDETLQEVATACENIATSSESIATSCDNVASSCGDIAKDTTLQSTNTALGSLAADATLQATNTALGELNTSLGGIIKDATGQSIDTSVGNISTVLSDVATDTTLATVAKDTTLQATNTALASLMADTTGQSIVSAISGLGQTLGSDKANIDGSNIANPSAFRSNIGIYTGQVVTDDDSTSVKTGSNYQVGLSLNLPAGSWYVLASCRVELKSANGRIMGNIGRATTFTTAEYFTQSCFSNKDVKLRVQTSAIVRPSETTTTYNYVLYSDDATAIYDMFHMIAIRIS